MWEGACPDSGVSVTCELTEPLLSGQAPSHMCFVVLLILYSRRKKPRNLRYAAFVYPVRWYIR